MGQRPLAHVALVVAVLSVGCAARSARDVAPPPGVAVDALIRDGCYLCLQEALRRMPTPGQSDQGRRKADEVAVVMALRERELGLADSGRLSDLEQRRSGLAADLQLLVDVAAAMPWSRRFAVDEDAALRRRATASRARWTQALTSLAPTSVVAEYVRLSLLCSYPDASAEPPTSTFDPTPLIRFRLATCRGRDVPALEALAASVPRFVEARYLVALDALIAGRPDEARRDLQQAFAALPQWPAAAIALAGLAFAVEDFETALARYRDAIAVDATHRDALLGEVKALSYLDRPAEAIAAAEHMLTLGEYFIGDAHYWRAWNLHRADRHVEAEAAVEQAKQYMRGPEASALAGYIAVSLRKFDQARADFSAALVDAPGECDVALALGGVEQQFAAWGAAGQRLDAAAECYVGRERELQEAIAKLPADDVRRRGARARDVAEARRQQGRAILAAAEVWLRAGNRDAARGRAERALHFPEVADEAGLLLKRLAP